MQLQGWQKLFWFWGDASFHVHWIWSKIVRPLMAMFQSYIELHELCLFIIISLLLHCWSNSNIIPHRGCKVRTLCKCWNTIEGWIDQTSVPLQFMTSCSDAGLGSKVYYMWMYLSGFRLVGGGKGKSPPPPQCLTSSPKYCLWCAICNESTAGADASVEMPKLHNIKLLIA